MAMQSPFFSKREPVTTGLRPAGVAASTNAQGVAQRAPVAAMATVAAATPQTVGSTLAVGPNIKRKGVEITDCDTLVVEGTVEATMDSRLLQIAPGGAFKGSVEIDIAEVHGRFDGRLTVREKLVVYATGRVSGTVRYGPLVVQEGGQISGDVGCTADNPPGKPVAVVKHGLQLA